MFQRILVPLDGSPRAERVAPIAARLARTTGGEVLLLQITSGAETTPPREFVPWEPRHTEAAAYLNQIAGREEFAGVRTQTLIREGAVVSEILAVAAASEADLIIVSHQPRASESARAPRSPGNVAERIAREAPTTVLLVRAPQSPLARVYGAQPCALRILIPLDGSLLAETALAPSAQLLEALGAPERSSLHLTQIVPSLGEWRGAARYLARIADRVRAGALLGRPLAVTWSVVPHVDPSEALIRVADLGEDPDTLTTWSVARDLGPAQTSAARNSAGFHRCDAIVMTTHGRGGLRRLLVGSVTEKVLRGASAPLMLVRRAPGEAPPQPLIQELDVDQWRT